MKQRSIFSQFETDKNHEKEGIWFDYPANWDGSIPRFKLARIHNGNTKYIANLEELQQKHKNDIDCMSNQKSLSLLIDVFVDSVLIDWANIKSPKKSHPFTREEAVSLLTRLPDLYRDLQEKASDISNYLTEEVECATKN